MDEYKAGEVYTFRGVPYRFKGGDPTSRTNWSRVTDPAAPAAGAAPFAGRSSAVGDFARMLTHGAAPALTHELAGLGAMVRTPFPGMPGAGDPAEAAAGARAASRERVADIRESRPWTAGAAEFLGGLAVPGAGGAKIGKEVLKRSGSRVLAGAAGGVAGGAFGGAVYGAGEAPEGEEVKGAIGGLTTGGAAGTVLGSAGALAGRVGNRIFGGPGGAQDLARNALRRALTAAGMTPEQALEKLRALPGGSVLADISPNLGREARAAANRAPALDAPDGPVQRVIRREADSNARVAGQLRAATGLGGKQWTASLEEAEKAVRDVARAVYGPLEAKYPKVQGENVLAIMRDPRIAQAARSVELKQPGLPDWLQQMDMEQNPALSRFLALQGTNAPSFRQLQAIRQYIKGQVEEWGRKGNPYWTEQWGEAARLLDDAITRDIPEFAGAQRAYRSAAKRVEAHELGKQLVDKDIDVIREALSELPTAEAKDAFRLGMLDVVEKRLQERTLGGAGTRNLMVDAGKTTLDWLRTMAGSDKGFADLLQNLEVEGRYRATARALTGNSTTAGQLLDAQQQFPTLPTTATQALQRLVVWAANSPEQRREAARILGTVLLSEGEEAAKLLATRLAARNSAAGAVGAAGGTAAAQQGGVF